MKTVFIPKGETVHYESLDTENLVVKGTLHVAFGVTAKHISGDGVIHAGGISADTIRARELETAEITCKSLIAERVFAAEVHASEHMLVSCYLSSAYVETGRLTVAMNDVETVEATQVINLTPKKRGLLGTLIASAWRALWLSLFTPATKAGTAQEIVADAEFEPVYEAARDQTAQTGEAGKEKPRSAGMAAGTGDAHPAFDAQAEQTDDFELQRIVAMFKLAREQGYTLKLVPGTPEDNAPIFGAGEDTILPAA